MALPSTLQVYPHFQPEEAAHAAAELISNFDNLPGEVVFLLEEIKEKDARINQLVQRINTRHNGLTKSAKSLASLPPSNATFPLPLPPNSPLPTSHLSAKDAQAVTKIQTEWGKVQTLQDEKLKLAERMERIINRAKERAKAEWLRVGGMEIEEVEPKIGGLGELGGGEVVLPPTGLGSGMDGRPQKKRKPNAIALPSPGISALSPSSSMPPPPAPHRPSLSSRPSGASHGHGLGHRLKARHSSAALTDPDADGEIEDADAEGETEMPEGQEGEADDTIYCICQQKSYGEMIGCDNEKCEYEWFHVKCVGISGATPETWYCPDCVKKLGLLSSDGKTAGQPKKGRKK
ncbi:hypothetical protein I317_00075 [Kwoniella heveanensis CBS 569]|uniref:Chromatin modification-related protein n=1 Tax=Kwoniella heveanensis BCC8398 TaxID=1296120 RepID=A0A1B9H1Q1_9TREE|nr:hypothetical protein I316_01108 [Kwoniella heveanensis BCC8398]OCF45987.1 hypothetical protein I317_00075 [Kwoniella heveanensis CBS 569]